MKPEQAIDIVKEYKDFTSRNNHTAAAKVLVDHFGTDEERKRIAEITALSEKRAVLPADVLNERASLGRKYFHKIRAMLYN
jgi:hypothetical protein